MTSNNFILVQYITIFVCVSSIYNITKERATVKLLYECTLVGLEKLHKIPQISNVMRSRLKKKKKER